MIFPPFVSGSLSNRKKIVQTDIVQIRNNLFLLQIYNQALFLSLLQMNTQIQKNDPNFLFCTTPSLSQCFPTFLFRGTLT